MARLIRLVSLANAENRFAAFHQFLYGFDGVVARLGVAGAVRQNMPSGLSAKTSSALVCAGTTVRRQPRAAKHTQDVGFYAEIIGDDVERLFGRVTKPLPSAHSPSVHS